VKKIFLGIFLFLFVFSAYADTVRVTGYGKTRKEALNDAFISAVQQSVGIMLETSVIIENQELIEERISARSEGFVDRYDVLSEYDGKAIVLDVSVKPAALNNLKNEIARALPVREVYSPEIIAAQERESSEGMQFKLEGKDIVAQRRTMELLIKERQQALKVKNAELFNRLLTTRLMADVYFEVLRSNNKDPDIFRIRFSFNQVINKVRYSLVIYEFHKLFMSVGANYSSYPLGELPFLLPPHTVVLVDISGTCRVYTFEERTFEGFGDLYNKFYILNYRTEIVLNFLNSNKVGDKIIKTKKISDRSFPTATSFFTNIKDKTLQSFTITPTVTNSEFREDITFRVEELNEIELFTGEYPAATLEKNSRQISADEKRSALIQKEQEKDMDEREFYSSFNALYNNKRSAFYLGLEAIYLPDIAEDVTDVSSLFGFTLEYDHFFKSLPALGFGIKGVYLGDNSSSEYKHGWEADYYNASILALLRIPIPAIYVNLHAFAGVGYADLQIEHAGTHEKYSANTTISTYGAGLEKYFDFFSVVFRYKFVYFYDGMQMAGVKTDEPMNGFEVNLGVLW
jgi:hypothetical protein